MKTPVLFLSVAMLALSSFSLSAQAFAQDPAPAIDSAKAAALFKSHCGDCHDPAVGEAPDRATLATHKPEDLFAIMKAGVMMPMAEGLSDDEKKAIASWLTTPAAPAA